MVIYTPPGYSQDQRYPVLYLLHGIGDTAGRLDARAGAGDPRQPDRRQASRADDRGDALWAGDATPLPRNIFDPSEFATYGNFDKELLRDIIPYVEAHYSAKPGPREPGAGGALDGGGQSLNIGLAHLDTFAWIGGFSSAPNTKPATESVTDPAAAAKQLRLLWISCGDRDNLMRISHGFHEALETMKVRAHLERRFRRPRFSRLAE